MRRALEYASMFGMPVIDHCEDPSLKGDGVVHEGARGAARPARHSRRGRGVMVERDIVARRAHRRPRPHRAHERAAVAARRARRQGARRARDLRGHAAPLRAHRRGAGRARRLRHERQDESAAARGGRPRRAARGPRATASIDAIATDHAPHHADEKALEFDRAPFGIVGLETAVSLCLDRLVHAGVDRAGRGSSSCCRPTRRASCGCRAARSPRAAPADVTVLAPDATRDRSARRRCDRNRRTRRSTAGRCAAPWRPRSSAGASSIVNRMPSWDARRSETSEDRHR